MNFNNCGEIYEQHPISAIELLGYAKNNVVEVKAMEEALPEEYRILLIFAYNMLDAVQEYLFKN